MKVDFYKLEDEKRHSRISIMRMESVEISSDSIENQVVVLVSKTRNLGMENEFSDVQMLSFCYAEDLYKWNIRNSAKDNN